MNHYVQSDYSPVDLMAAVYVACIERDLESGVDLTNEKLKAYAEFSQRCMAAFVDQLIEEAWA